MFRPRSFSSLPRWDHSDGLQAPRLPITRGACRPEVRAGQSNNAAAPDDRARPGLAALGMPLVLILIGPVAQEPCSGRPVSLPPGGLSACFGAAVLSAHSRGPGAEYQMLRSNSPDLLAIKYSRRTLGRLCRSPRPAPPRGLRNARSAPTSQLASVISDKQADLR